jgi:hypothetical protein
LPERRHGEARERDRAGERQPASEVARRRVPGRAGERAVAEAEDRREEDEQRHAAEHGGRAQRGGERPRRRAPQRAVEQRVERQQDEVVEQDGGDQPGDDVRRGRAVEQPREDVGREREVGQVAGEVPRRGTVAAGEPADHAGISSSRATHLVLWTPGSAGTMIRAG